MKSINGNSNSGKRKSFRQTFRALRHRNYRLFFIGQGISLIGTWMQQIALTWLVYRLTNSAFLLGLVGFTGLLPIFLVSPFAGVIADRTNRQRVVIITQSLAMGQSVLLTILTLTGLITVWHILLLSAFLGLINAFDIPTRQSFLHEMLDGKEDLSNAIALNSSMFNSARLIGPSVAGILIALVGEGMCFMINSISFIAVLYSLAAIKVPVRKIETHLHGVIHGLKEGFHYALHFKPIKYILALVALVSVMGMQYAVLMPIFARDILHGGPHTLGFLMGSTGVGALSGALFLASRNSVIGLGKWIPVAATIFGAGLICFAFSHTFILSAILLFIIGFGMMVQMASSNTILQTVADDDKRGRVMSFYTMAFTGMAPFGSIIAGSLASTIGAQYTLLISGVVCIIGAFFFSRKLPIIRKLIRPIYVRDGILEEISTSL